MGTTSEVSNYFVKVRIRLFSKVVLFKCKLMLISHTLINVFLLNSLIIICTFYWYAVFSKPLKSYNNV